MKVYTQLFSEIQEQAPLLRRRLGVDAAAIIAKTLAKPPPIGFSDSQLERSETFVFDKGAADRLAARYERYLREFLKCGLKSPAPDVFRRWLKSRGMLKRNRRGELIYLDPKPTRVEMNRDRLLEIRTSLAVSSSLAGILDPTSSRVVLGAGRATAPSEAASGSPILLPLEPHSGEPLEPGPLAGRGFDGPPPPPVTPAPSRDGSKAPAPSPRSINVRGYDEDGQVAKSFNDDQIYRLRFGVGDPSGDNLAQGRTSISDIPEGGLDTRWVVTSQGVEFLAIDSGTIEEIERGWKAVFDLHIPQTGPSRQVELTIRPTGGLRRVFLVLLATDPEGGREVYRQLTADLEGEPQIAADSTAASPGHLNLSTTHEWTTPPEHVQIIILGNFAHTTTVRGPRDRAASYRWSAHDNNLTGPIKNVLSSLEGFRNSHEAYLNDLSPDDIAGRLQSFAGRNWDGGFQASPAHERAYRGLLGGKALRDLCADGHRLYQTCFPDGSPLRTLIEGLSPGSRIDFRWTPSGGAGRVAHVPWALMYMGTPDVAGRTPPDPRNFLGLRFRLGNQAKDQANASRALGSPQETTSLHLLYWGDNKSDKVGAESRWQAGLYRSWDRQRILPDPAKRDRKSQMILGLDSPEPSPVSVLHFYCHCSVGEGNDPVLRFGNSSREPDVLKRNDLSQRPLADAPLVFANACTTAAADPHMTSELQQRFFDRGIRSFIGTETKVPIELASRFAWLFFEFFLRRVDPAPMAAGEALAQARHFLWTQYRNIGGLFYSQTNQYDLFWADSAEVEGLRR